MIEELKSINKDLISIQKLINSSWYKNFINQNKAEAYDFILSALWIKECRFINPLSTIRKIYQEAKEQNNSIFLLLEPIGKQISLINKAYLDLMDIENNPILNPNQEWIYLNLTTYQELIIPFDKTIRHRLNDAIQTITYLILYLEKKE